MTDTFEPATEVQSIDLNLYDVEFHLRPDTPPA